MDRLSVAEENERRDRSDAELVGLCVVFIHIDFSHRQAFAIGGGELLKDRCNGMTRTAPIGPKVDKNELTALP